MDKEYIRKHLPQHPPEDLLKWAKRGLSDNLGGDYCIFHSERVPVELTMDEVMMYNSTSPRRKEWAAVCTCSACQNDFITQKEAKSDNILLAFGEDGCHYPIAPGEEIGYWLGLQKEGLGDEFPCPICENMVQLVHERQVKGGRTKQVMVITVENVEGYTGIFYWMVWRTINEWGISDYGVNSKDAYILTERGSLVRYSHYGIATGTDLPIWVTMHDSRDTSESIYSDWGSINNRKRGAAVFDQYPDLEGTTGEKTGLIEYLRAGGGNPVAYLKKWRRHRCLENLCRCGQARLVAEIVSLGYRKYFDFFTEANKYIDLTRNKPHEMLRFSKNEFKQLRKDGYVLTIEIMDQWKHYANTIPEANFRSYTCNRALFGERGLRDALCCVADYPGTTIEKLYRYLKKQDLHTYEVRLLLDTRGMTRRLYNRDLNQEELWPRRLQETHDRISQMVAERDITEKARELAEGFIRVREQFGELEWNDGELCVILPKENAELVREGKALRHCVGGYGRGHAKGDSLIFFIRRYRRPERPYYTLNIRMGDQPQEVQLHGYGNERHGPNKEYRHRIPAKVRSFCDRWKREILLPWYAAHQKQLKEEQSA